MYLSILISYHISYQIIKNTKVMKRLISLIIILIPIFNVSADEFLHGFIQGNYLLVGKAPESDKTYQGKVQILEKKSGLVAIRSIDGQRTEATAAVESVLAGEAKVLRIRFAEGESKYEETCLIDTDLDNYARLSCYLYHADGHTTKPGLEALFYNQSAEN